MVPTLNREKALIFRITHVRNLGEILEKGCQSRSQAKRASGYVEIGNHELIEKRAARIVPCGPGGTLNDYVPFYFTPFTPMLMNIKTGYGVPLQSMSDIILLVSSLYRLQKLGIPFVFSDRHAYLKTARFSDDLDDLDLIIWDTLRARNFRKDDIDRFEKYQAEALVHRHVPLDALLSIVCNNFAVKQQVQALVDQRDVLTTVIAQPSWYL